MAEKNPRWSSEIQNGYQIYNIYDLEIFYANFDPNYSQGRTWRISYAVVDIAAPSWDWMGLAGFAAIQCPQVDVLAS